jgi:Family of unknown function (DUF5677)
VGGRLHLQEQVVDRQKRKATLTVSRLLARLQREVTKHGEFLMAGKNTDFFLGVLKSSFVKAYDFARYANRFKLSQANESSFFMTAGLRGICEDIIALRFIEHLPTEFRQQIVILELGVCSRKAIEAQMKFFEKERPFQPILRYKTPGSASKDQKDKYTEIGTKVGLKSIKEKLPPVEQMAQKVGLKDIYEYFYRVTSETVHFNVHVALRNGWGPIPSSVRFGTKQFCRYYLLVNQVYGVFLFCLMCETFQASLGLSQRFMQGVARVRKHIDEILRWPEPVTFEEMNIAEPSPIIRIALKIAHDDELQKKQLAKT